MALVGWPDLDITSASVDLQDSSRSGGVSLSGHEQVVASGADRWRATVNVQIRDRRDRLFCQAFRAGMRGRVNTTLVPFSAINERIGTTARTSGVTAVGATQIGINLTAGESIDKGEHFSHNGLLYVITSLIGGEFKILPPLRAQIGNNVLLEFNAPTCEMKFASDDTGEMMLDLLRMSDVTFDFIEAF